ncbi:unnamed protein product [Ostreobium quekettii]|uniref:AP2/ERF domain-containing protein n=1 Tax=Ostreobium quekettii TaxID=121088 RepID=A0A8S1J831_9CHLO|nr:unnamed protein product [Ostreobium quekettii]
MDLDGLDSGSNSILGGQTGGFGGIGGGLEALAGRSEGEHDAVSRALMEFVASEGAGPGGPEAEEEGEIWPIPIFGDHAMCDSMPLLDPLACPRYDRPGLTPITCPAGLATSERSIQQPFSARCFTNQARAPWPDVPPVQRNSSSAPNRRAKSFGSPEAIGLSDAALELGLPGGSMRIDGMGPGEQCPDAYWAQMEQDLVSPRVAEGALRKRPSPSLSGEGATSSQSSGTPVGSRVRGTIQQVYLKRRGSARGRGVSKRTPAGESAAVQQPSVGSSEVDGVAEGSVLADGGPEGQALDSPPKEAKAGRVRGKAAQKTSQYNGVSKHRRSGRWEAHIWVNDFGRQIYLGGFDVPEDAAAAYDMVAIKSKGLKASTNFDVGRYLPLWDWLQTVTLPELVTHMRRRSKGFSRGTSKYRGVTRHPTGRWESRIGVHGSRHIYLGLYPEEEAAAKHYDRALVRLRGVSAATNFSLSGYANELSEHKWMQQQLAADRKETLGTTKYNKWVRHGGKDVAIFN